MRPEPSTVYAEPNLKLICPPHETSKFEEMDLDEHTQTSVSVDLINDFNGSSKYLNDRPIPTQATFTFIFRLISTVKHLEIPSIVCKSVSTKPNTQVSHVVTGIIYGVSAYCVLVKNLNPDVCEEEDQLEVIENLSELAETMKKSLLNHKNVMEFKELLTLEEKRTVDVMKCRLYSDLPTDSECSVYEAYEHYFQLIDGIKTGVTASKAVSISVLLCPLDLQVIKTPQGNEISSTYNKDVDYSLVEQFVMLYNKLGRIRAKSHDDVTSAENHPSLRQFEATIAKYQVILTNSMKKAVVKARGKTCIEDTVEQVLKFASDHKLFQPSRLKQWRNCKKTELHMMMWMANIPGITLMLDDTKLKKELTESIDRKNALVLNIEELDSWTSSALCDMEDYVSSYTKFDHEELEKDSDKHSGIPSSVNETNKLLDKIRELICHVERSQQLEEKADYFITISSDLAHDGYNYSVYSAGKLVIEKLDKLPSPPENVEIVESGQHSAKGSNCLLRWNYEDFGFPCHFIVQYRLKGTFDLFWEEKRTMKPGEMKMDLNFESGSVVEFRMATETIFGLSEFSDIVEHEFGIDGVDLVSV